MKKGENILIVIISLALVACVVMGCVAAFKRIYELFSEEKDTGTTETDVPDDTESDVVSDTEPSITDPNLYINEATGTGYHIVDNKTYFFRVYEYDASLENDLVFNDASFKTFDSYSCIFYYAIVNDSTTDITWKTQPLLSNAESLSNSLSLTSTNHTIYITYTVISDCSNPTYVLSDLNQNVFFDDGYDGNFYIYRTTIYG